MERHQTGQEEMLMKVTMKGGSLEDIHLPGGSPADHRDCSKCRVALGAVMGLVIGALVTVFVLYFVIFTASSKQDAPLSVAFRPTKSEKHEGYDIWTVDKGATYLIYGWVKFSNITKETVNLLLIDDTPKFHTRTLQNKTVSETEIFFFCQALLAEDISIVIQSKSHFTDSLFHVYKQ